VWEGMRFGLYIVFVHAERGKEKKGSIRRDGPSKRPKSSKGVIVYPYLWPVFDFLARDSHRVFVRHRTRHLLDC
jgi:hypothetical protein